MKRITAVFFLILFIASGCGVSKKVKNLTDTANQLLENINNIVLQVDAQVESGDLSEDVGNFIDDRLNNLAAQIESMLENAGGMLFDEVNGTIDNTFSNISMLLDQIKKGILDDSLPNLIDQISYQVQNNINLLSSSVEDIVVLTFGNTFILVDKTINGAVIIFALIFLAVGLIIFAIMLFRKKRKANFFRIAAYIFMLVYVGFFLAILMSSRWRGELIAGFDFAQKYEGIQLKPKITGVFPETFTMGKNDKIFLYGKYLNKIDTLKVVLKQGNLVKFTFPAKTLVAKTQSKIVIGNLSRQIWKLPTYIELQQRIPLQDRSLFRGVQYMQYSKEVEKNAYRLIPEAVTSAPIHALTPVSPPPSIAAASVAGMHLSGSLLRIKPGEVIAERNNIGHRIFNSATALKVNNILKSFYLNSFHLPEGDFAIEALENNEGVESEQFISILYPPPPVPKPDIFITGLRFSNQNYAIAKQDVTLDVQLGFSHPEEVKRGFRIRVNATPAITPMIINVPMGVIAAAQGNNRSVVTSRRFRLNQKGIYVFRAIADENNMIAEQNESNNEYQKSLQVRDYYYNVTVQYLTFVSLKNMDDGLYPEDEYRITIGTVVSHYSPWTIKYNKDGEPNRNYSINKTKTFERLHEGDQIFFSTTGYEADSGSKDGDDGMGHAGKTVKISSLINSFPSGSNSIEKSLILITSHYKIIGKYSVKRIIE